MSVQHGQQGGYEQPKRRLSAGQARPLPPCPTKPCPLPPSTRPLPTLPPAMDKEFDTYGALWNDKANIEGPASPPPPPPPLERNRKTSRPLRISEGSRKVSSSSSVESCGESFSHFNFTDTDMDNRSPPPVPVDLSVDPLPASSTFDPDAFQSVLRGSLSAKKNLTPDDIINNFKEQSSREQRPTLARTTSAINRSIPQGQMTDMTLKEREVFQLKQEMAHPGGVKVELRKRDCYMTLALVDLNNDVWIAGWNQKARPFLHAAFHIGDQLVSVNSYQATTASESQRVIKAAPDDSKIVFIIRRMPRAKVFAIKRSAEGESLGFKREGGTAEIGQVNTTGLAARNGLSSKATTMDGMNFCNWILTEINNRPLNLTFKDQEIEYRLNAVGKDISITVQPYDFIKALKKQLKTLKNHKDYLVE